MPFSLDPEVAAALAPMGEAMAAMTPPAVGDVAGRRALWEPILAASGAALPAPADVRSRDVRIPTDDGATITARWYAKDGAPAGPAALFFHGGGYMFGHVDHFDGPVARYVSASGVPMLSVEYRRASTPTRRRSRTGTRPCAGCTTTRASSTSTPRASA